jgi:hypothetical protein
VNLADDIVTGSRSVEDARAYYAKEFLDAKRKAPTPYMERLHFKPDASGAADPDERVISDQELEAAKSGRSGAAMSGARRTT